MPDASPTDIDEAFDIARTVWDPTRFSAPSDIRAQAESELKRAESAYRRLRPSASRRHSDAVVEETNSSKQEELTCPYCQSRLRPNRAVYEGSKVRCPSSSCLQVFTVGQPLAPPEPSDKAAEAETSRITPFSAADCDIHFELEGNLEQLPGEYVVLSGYSKHMQLWAAAADDEADLGLRHQLESCDEAPIRLYRVLPDGTEVPSWAAQLSVDDARAIAASYDQEAFYFVRRGGLAIVACGPKPAVLTLGAGRIRSRSADRHDD